MFLNQIKHKKKIDLIILPTSMKNGYHKKKIGCVDRGTPISKRRARNQNNLVIQVTAALYLDSILERKTTFYLLECHETKLSHKNT